MQKVCSWVISKPVKSMMNVMRARCETRLRTVLHPVCAPARVPCVLRTTRGGENVYNQWHDQVSLITVMGRLDLARK